MDPLKWTRNRPGEYVAENKLRTRRYVIFNNAPRTWTLTVWNLKEHKFSIGDPLYLTDGPRQHIDWQDTKWEAQAHANMWEAEKQGDREAKTKFHNDMVDRWIGTDLPEDLTNELRDRLYN